MENTIETPNIEINSFEGFIKFCNHLSSGFVYRGHADEKWELLPTLLRKDEHSRNKIARYVEKDAYHYQTLINTPEKIDIRLLQHIEFENIKKFISKSHYVGLRLPFNSVSLLEKYRSLSDHPVDFPVADWLEVLALMQHYGVPTSLLDWSKNPLTALYFACHGNLDQPIPVDKKMTVWALDIEKLIDVKRQYGKDNSTFQSKKLPYAHKLDILGYYYSDSEINKNLSVQKGCFTYYNIPDVNGYENHIQPLDKYIESIRTDRQKEMNAIDDFMYKETKGGDVDNFLVRINFPANLSHQFISHLQKFGTTYSSIYPSYESCLKEIEYDEIIRFANK